MQVVLYDVNYRNPFSILTALVTACGISHASIVQDGVNYDTEFERGSFGIANAYDQPKRMVTVFDIPDFNGMDAIKSMLGTPYDTVGLFLWPLNIHNKKKLYCFEAVMVALKAAGFDTDVGRARISGQDIANLLTNKGFVGRRTQARYILPN